MADFTFNPLSIALKPLLDKAMAEDTTFAQEVKEKTERKDKPKSLDECCKYIMGEAYKYAKEHKQGNFGLAGCPDEMVVGMIKHYYDEDDITITEITGATAKVATPTAQKKTETKKTNTKGKIVVDTRFPFKPTKTEKKTEDKPKLVKIEDLSKKELKQGKDTGDLFSEFFI